MQITCSKCGFSQEAQPHEMLGRLHICERCGLFFNWELSESKKVRAVNTLSKKKENELFKKKQQRVKQTLDSKRDRPTPASQPQG